MAEKKEAAVDADLSKATPLAAGDPVEVPPVMGATFAERAKAQSKQVDAETEQVEDKSVGTSKTTRKRAKS